ncbi:MAG: hypothetical protein ACTSQF_02970 [Candidatus Heimdallarchaeaceae archaeon]
MIDDEEFSNIWQRIKNLRQIIIQFHRSILEIMKDTGITIMKPKMNLVIY